MSFWVFLIIIILVGWAVDKSIRDRIKMLEKALTQELYLLDKKLDDVKELVLKN